MGYFIESLSVDGQEIPTFYDALQLALNELQNTAKQSSCKNPVVKWQTTKGYKSDYDENELKLHCDEFGSITLRNVYDGNVISLNITIVEANCKRQRDEAIEIARELYLKKIAGYGKAI